MLRIVKSLTASGLLAWAVLDLSGSTGLAVTAALVPLGLGMSNLLPFATMALPVVMAGVAVAGRLVPDGTIDAAATTLMENAGHVRGVVAAHWPPTPN